MLDAVDHANWKEESVASGDTTVFLMDARRSRGNIYHACEIQILSGGVLFVGTRKVRHSRPRACGTRSESRGAIKMEGRRVWINSLSLVIQHGHLQQKERRSWRQSKRLRMENSKTWCETIEGATLEHVDQREKGNLVCL